MADPVILDLWHPISALDEIPTGIVNETLLLGERVSYTTTADGELFVWRSNRAQPAGVAFDPRASGDLLPYRSAIGYLWTSLGSPPEDVFPVPEYDEPDRRSLNAGSFTVATSAPRAVENFLDVAHFPYLHPNVLGVLPHTEVPDYDVEVIDGELIADRCGFYVPAGAPNVGEPAFTYYRFRVPHPYCVLSYFPSLEDPAREDIVGIVVQAMTEERIRAHNYMGVIDRTTSDNAIRRFQLGLFGEDQLILENQVPKRLPLDPRAETPVRADLSGVAYRRWLVDLGVRYGVVRPGEAGQ